MLFRSVRVTGIDWSVGPIPLCKAEAWFKVPVVHGFDDLDLDVLREADGVCLEDAVCFKWSVPGNARTDELDFTYGSHSGVEFWIDEDGDGNESPGVATPQSEDEGRVEVVSMAEELAGLHGQQREAIRVSLERSAKAGRIILVK